MKKKPLTDSIITLILKTERRTSNQLKWKEKSNKKIMQWNTRAIRKLWLYRLSVAEALLHALPCDALCEKTVKREIFFLFRNRRNKKWFSFDRVFGVFVFQFYAPSVEFQWKTLTFDIVFCVCPSLSSLVLTCTRVQRVCGIWNNFNIFDSIARFVDCHRAVFLVRLRVQCTWVNYAVYLCMIHPTNTNHQLKC